MTFMTPTIPKIALRALTELTGEPRAEVALLVTLKDAIQYRLAIIEEDIQAFEQKYKLSFEEFRAQGEKVEIPNQFSYEIESDYLEWEGLISRKKNLENIEQWLI